jgi:tetratricopeptide (TPR) repeat protein
LSVAQQWNGDYANGMASARQALDYLPIDDVRDHVIARATALDLAAEATYYSISETQAVAPYRQALALLTDFERRYPGDQVIDRRIARAQWALGSTLAGYGDAQEAVAMLTDSARRSREILEADPEDEDARRMLRIIENARGQALAQVGRLDEGIAIVRANIAERKAYLDQRADDPMRLRDYMIAIKGLGDMQLEHGRRADACRTYAWARKVIGVIKARGQLTALDLMSSARSVEDAGRKECAAFTGSAATA